MPIDKAYWAAERKIHAAYIWGAKEIDLSGLGLSEFPASLSQIKQLRALNLSGNRLTALPETLGHLTKLERLTLKA